MLDETSGPNLGVRWKRFVPSRSPPSLLLELTVLPSSSPNKDSAEMATAGEFLLSASSKGLKASRSPSGDGGEETDRADQLPLPSPLPPSLSHPSSFPDRTPWTEESILCGSLILSLLHL